MGAAPHDAHDLIAELHPRHGGPRSGHRARELQPRHLVCSVGPRIQPHALEQVGPIHGRRDDVDEHVLGSDQGIRDIPDGQHLRPAVLLQHYRTHTNLRHSSLATYPRTPSSAEVPARRALRIILGEREFGPAH